MAELSQATKLGRSPRELSLPAEAVVVPLSRFHCAGGGYGASSRITPERCPMSSGKFGQHHEAPWSGDLDWRRRSGAAIWSGEPRVLFQGHRLCATRRSSPRRRFGEDATIEAKATSNKMTAEMAGAWRTPAIFGGVWLEGLPSSPSTNQIRIALARANVRNDADEVRVGRAAYGWEGPVAAGGSVMDARTATSGAFGMRIKPRVGRSRSKVTRRSSVISPAASRTVVRPRPRIAR